MIKFTESTDIAPERRAEGHKPELSDLWILIQGGEESHVTLVSRTKSQAISKVTDSLFHLTDEHAHRIVKRGVPSSAIGVLGSILGIGKAEIAEHLDLDRGTASRWTSQNKALPIHASEAVLRLVELYEMSTDTFETPDEALAWIQRAHPLLEGETPLEAAKTSYGASRVKDILLAIKYGGVV